MEPNQFMAFMALRLQQQQVAAQQALDENQPLDFSTQRLNLSKYLPQRNLSLDSEGNSPRVSERQRLVLSQNNQTFMFSGLFQNNYIFLFSGEPRHDRENREHLPGRFFKLLQQRW